MSYSCPLNFTQVDSNASRLSSFIVALLVILYLFNKVEYILYFLILDFSIRLFVDKKYSPISILALNLRKMLKIQEKIIDGGGKRLAGIFGLVFVSLLVVSHFIAWDILTLAIAGVFLACSLLDVFINYCLGCQVYYIVKKIYPSFMD